MEAEPTNAGRRISDRFFATGQSGYVETPGEIRAQALRFIGLTALIEGVLILTRWVLLPSLLQTSEDSGWWPLGGSLAIEFAWVAMYAGAAAMIWLVRPEPKWCVRTTLALVVASVSIAIARRMVGVDPGPGGHALATMLIVHTAGASMLPWSPKQAMIVAGFWVALSSAALLIWGQHLGDGFGEVSAAAGIFATVAVTVPGTMIAFFRSSRLRDRFTVRVLEDRYASVREELTAARQIHEGGFPQPRVTGDVRFAYEYRPMSQIGGDYVFAAIDTPEDPASPVSLVLLDVTGHGIPAALTVNRLQGELARLIAEYPGMSAGAMLEQLNRYVYLTLAEQSVFVTAVAMRADPSIGKVEIANAGHPPLLLHRSNGVVESFGATATVLGAIEPDEYRSRPVTVVLEPGDSLIAFTDGVTEARAQDGSMFGSQGVVGVIDAGRTDPSVRWPQRIAEAVQKHHPGPPTDDTLIVEMYRVATGAKQ
ncbi:MAG: PP2C family protein-serine/threonine phosphatase [Phycisphaerales bacterium]